ncbi:MAG: hypothetical protein JSV31_26580 [Desulfobacterales bacterium]|nr:MAG: hypothetical protein JSV31_26580 [Desulfobacterales bacterium]
MNNIYENLILLITIGGYVVKNIHRKADEELNNAMFEQLRIYWEILIII